MRISTATIDCWLWLTANGYSDYQHHHWDIGPSGTIDTTVNNKPTYTWTVYGFGQDSNGSWSTTNQNKTLIAQVRISSPTTVSLTQTQGFGVNTLPATGSTPATNHTVPELTWPPDLTWSPTLFTPSSSSHLDMGQPTIQQGPPVAVPVTPPTFPPTLTLLATFAFTPGIGGRDWTHKSQYFQIPSPFTALAWWAWTINLAP